MLILIGWQFQVRQPSDYIMNKTEFYADLNRDFNALMAGETSFLATLANTSALLYERLTDVNWAGFYLLEDDTLVLGPFQGKIACVRIPVGPFPSFQLEKLECKKKKNNKKLSSGLPCSIINFII